MVAKGKKAPIRTSARAVRRQENRIRDLVNHSLLQNELTNSLPKFNRICACLDAIGDASVALECLDPKSNTEEGHNYLITHGVYQSISLLLDAARVIARETSIGLPESHQCEIQQLLDLRIQISGHPYDDNGNKKSGRRAGASGIGNYSISPSGFILHQWFDDGSRKTLNVNHEDSARNALSICRNCLAYIAERLKKRIRHLEREWNKSPAAAHFIMAGYASEKLLDAVRKTDRKPTGPWAVEHLKQCIDGIRADERLMSSWKDPIEYDLEGVDWTIERLLRCFSGDVTVSTEESMVLARYLRDRIDSLWTLCRSIDTCFSGPKPTFSFEKPE